MQKKFCVVAALVSLTSYSLASPAVADEESQPRVVACTRITNATQLQAMRNNLAGKYCLANDIDAGTIPNFKPVGTAANRFTGRLFGNDHVIRNLNINNPGDDVGLFGSTDGAVIQDIRLVNVNVRGPDGAYIGALVGTAYGTSAASRIARISVTGLVRSSGASSLGGIAGLLNDNVVLMQSRSAASIVATGAASESGGLVANNNGTIQQSFANGTIMAGANGNAGGLVAVNNPGSVVQQSFATGPVSAGDNSSVGGLVGRQNDGSVTEGYAVGVVSGGAGASVGGLIGETTGGPIVMNSYWDTQTSGQMTSGGGLGGGLLTTQFRADLPPGFAGEWAITKTLSYPFLNDPELDFTSPLATLVRASRAFVFLPVGQLDAAEYATAPMHADEASLAAVYTMIARGVGVAHDEVRLKNVKIDRYFWDDATQTTTWSGPVKNYVTLGALTALAAATPLDSTNVIGRMNAQRLVILRGVYRKSDNSVAAHWLLGTLYTTNDSGGVSTIVAHDPVTGSQIEIDPDTKTVLTPDFPLMNFRVNGYRHAVVN